MQEFVADFQIKVFKNAAVLYTIQSLSLESDRSAFFHAQ